MSEIREVARASDPEIEQPAAGTRVAVVDDGDRITVRSGQRVRTAKIEFAGDFEGLWAEVKVRAPYKFVRMLADDEKIPEALAQLVVGHNLPDAETGDILPAKLGPEDAECLDFGLVVKLVEGIVDAVQKAGKSSRR